MEISVILSTIYMINIIALPVIRYLSFSVDAGSRASFVPGQWESPRPEVMNRHRISTDQRQTWWFSRW